MPEYRSLWQFLRRKHATPRAPFFGGGILGPPIGPQVRGVALPSGEGAGAPEANADGAPAPANSDLWQVIQNQRAALSKLQRKYDTVKGQLRHALADDCRTCSGLGSIEGFLLGTRKRCPACNGSGRRAH